MAVKSMYFFCKEPISWTVVVENEDLNELKNRPWSKPLKIVPTEDIWPESFQIPPPYVRQQYIKMHAYRVMNGYFWNLDSDVITKKEFTSAKLEDVRGRPTYWISSYNNIETPVHRGIFSARRDLLKRTFSVPEVQFEYMRQMPIPCHSDILKQGSGREEWRRYFDVMRGAVTNPGISEFNMIGLFAHMHFPHYFDWRDAESQGPTWGQPDGIFHQHWSYGPMPDDIQKWVRLL